MISIQEALTSLSDGHSIWTIGHAEDICKAVGVKFPKNLIQTWKSDPPGTLKGLTMKRENSRGVSALTLSSYVYETLKATGARDCIGRGFQAQQYATAIEKKLKELGRM